jgi:hypothetical protein
MKFSEIPLVEYIDIEEQRVDLYIHTKDKRIIFVSDVQTDMFIDSFQVVVEHMMFSHKVSFVMMREDFSHLEYRVSDRQGIEDRPRRIYRDTQEADSVDDFIDYHSSEVLREP